uniref:Serine hydrolase domain-containing protein n=1 Tax=Alexandrium catenella TaxID=2925 RepID=A0A7S1RH34_ALECA|mmetsp:Transcript_57349/g.153631  ORF Transcript_57349/g.153631 Transcript_57349/m.153631 type:complete len:364 (+) Transcript_57349:61-1152(+)
MGDVLWEVVGGAAKGGIVVRQGEDVQSPMEEERLSTGALLRILKMSGERLNFERVSGTGPSTGWVSEKLKDGKDLVQRTETPAPPPKPDRKTTAHSTGELYVSCRTSDYKGPTPPPTDRPTMRVLVLHGGGSNASAIKFQSVRMKTLMKAYSEWDFMEGDVEWDDVELSHHTPREPGEERIKGKGPYRSWFRYEFEPPRLPGWSDRELHFEGDPDFKYKVTFKDFESAMAKVRKHIAEKGPFDVIMGFSMACSVLTGLAATLLREEAAVPWRLLVLFNGMWIRDEGHATLCSPPLCLPCVQVYGRNDHFRRYQADRLTRAFADPIVLEHDGNHSFPAPDLEHAEDFYAEVIASMRWHCGMQGA